MNPILCKNCKFKQKRNDYPVAITGGKEILPASVYATEPKVTAQELKLNARVPPSSKKPRAKPGPLLEFLRSVSRHDWSFAFAKPKPPVDADQNLVDALLYVFLEIQAAVAEEQAGGRVPVADAGLASAFGLAAARPRQH